MTFGHGVPEPRETYDENTLFKVYDALREDGHLTEKQARQCINAMQNKGILFRERAQKSTPSGPVYRGLEREAGHDIAVDAEPVPS